jgi:hypothetical protein
MISLDCYSVTIVSLLNCLSNSSSSSGANSSIGDVTAASVMVESMLSLVLQC